MCQIPKATRHCIFDKSKPDKKFINVPDLGRKESWTTRDGSTLLESRGWTNCINAAWFNALLLNSFLLLKQNCGNKKDQNHKGKMQHFPQFLIGIILYYLATQSLRPSKILYLYTRITEGSPRNLTGWTKKKPSSEFTKLIQFNPQLLKDMYMHTKKNADH